MLPWTEGWDRGLGLQREESDPQADKRFVIGCESCHPGVLGYKFSNGCLSEPGPLDKFFKVVRGDVKGTCRVLMSFSSECSSAQVAYFGVMYSAPRIIHSIQRCKQPNR